MTYKQHFSGTWYDTNYTKQIDKFIDLTIKVDDTIKAILVPHAGYRYSGLCMAKTYQHVNFENITNIVILSTFHKNLDKCILPGFDKIIFDGKEIKVGNYNDKFTNKSSLCDTDNKYFNAEHSFENQLPMIVYFNRHRLDKITVYPILVGHVNFDDYVEHLASFWGPNTLFIVNSDMTHYGKRYGFTFEGPDIERLIKDKDIDDMLAIIVTDIKTFKKLGGSVCGKNAILLFMTVLQYLRKQRNLHIEPSKICYDTSFNVEFGTTKNLTNDDSSVSYLGIVWHDRTYHHNGDSHQMSQIGGDDTKINIYKEAGYKIQNVPRYTLFVAGKIMEKFKPEDFGYLENPNLYVNLLFKKVKNKLDTSVSIDLNGIFVTIDEYGKLAGCLGIFYDDMIEMLSDTKMNMIDLVILYTLKTVFLDSRFPNMSLRDPKNYKDIMTNRYSFKINLLGPDYYTKPEEFWDNYIPCTSGIILEYKGRSATYLPMVMLDQGWISDCENVKKMTDNKKQKFEEGTFASLFNKMGYPGTDYKEWKNGKVYIYSAKEIEENIKLTV